LSRESRVTSHEMPPEWGAAYDGRTLSISITPPAASMSVDRARFGRTVADLRVKSRPDRVVIQVGIRFGPPLPIHVELARGEVWQVLVDENAVSGTAAAFVASHEHEVQLLLLAASS